MHELGIVFEIQKRVVAVAGTQQEIGLQLLTEELVARRRTGMQGV